MNRYRVLLPLLVNGEHGQGDEFDWEFTPSEEQDNLNSGLLEIVPRRYRVVGDSEVYGVRKTDKDPTFEQAMQIEPEAMLIQAGHIERVEEKPEPKPKPRKKKEG